MYLRTRYRSKLGCIFWFGPIHVTIHRNLVNHPVCRRQFLLVCALYKRRVLFHAFSRPCHCSQGRSSPLFLHGNFCPNRLLSTYSRDPPRPPSVRPSVFSYLAGFWHCEEPTFNPTVSILKPYNLGRPRIRDVFFSFLLEVPVINWLHNSCSISPMAGETCKKILYKTSRTPQIVVYLKCNCPFIHHHPC